ncbi:MAG TPA: hypothetical protein VEK57_16675 [Thermoanaerobaculia bacterium]|nr:hypothetical protein [Thermoanaerobaculia bacterium]
MRQIARILMITAFALVPFTSAAIAQEGGERTCGNEYAAYGMEGLTYAEALEYAGQVHNEFQEEVLTELVAEGVDLRDIEGLPAILEAKSKAFFARRGIDDSHISYDFCMVPGKSGVRYQPERYSPEAAAILGDLKTLVEGYEAGEDAAFFESLEVLKERALSLPDEKEVFATGVPVSIAIHSAYYWNANLERWVYALTGEQPAARRGRFAVRAERTFSVKAVLGADVGGAAVGAVVGLLGGPAGVAGGALANGARASVGSAIIQGVRWLTNWW